jgi:hypothetical protein
MKRLLAMFGRKHPTKKLFLRILVIPNDNGWTAQGIEFDIVAQGESVHDAILSFERVLLAWFELDKELQREPLSALPPAPEKYRNMFDEASVALTDRHKQHDSMPTWPMNLGSPELRLYA